MAIVKKVLAGVGSFKSWVIANFAKIGHTHDADEVTVAESGVTDVGTVQDHVELLTGRINTNATSIDYLNGEVTTLHQAVAQRSKVGHSHPATSVNVAASDTVSADTVQAHIEHLTENKSNVDHTHSEYAPISHTHELTTVTAYIYVMPTMTGATGTMNVIKGTVSINPGSITEAWSYSITLTNASGTTTTLESGIMPTKKDINVSEAGTLTYLFYGQGYHNPTTGVVGSISQTRFSDAIPL